MKRVGNIEQEEDLFFEALGHADLQARSAFLERTCAGKPALRARVEKLLAAQTEAESFFAEAQRATRLRMGAYRSQ